MKPVLGQMKFAINNQIYFYHSILLELLYFLINTVTILLINKYRYLCMEKVYYILGSVLSMVSGIIPINKGWCYYKTIKKNQEYKDNPI